MSSSVTARRALGLVLLVALCAGPTGIAAVLHPLDDVEYRTATATPDGSCSMLAAPEEPGAHCPTCHLIRGVRWGVSASPVPGIAPQAFVPLAGATDTLPSLSLQFTTPGRSPPPAGSVQTA
jgi:hypothetical protein